MAIALLSTFVRLSRTSFGEPVDYRADSKRKDVSATIAQRIRAMLNSSLRGRDIA